MQKLNTVLLLVVIVLLAYIASMAYSLRSDVSTIMKTDESLESVEYFVYDNGTIKIVRDNGDVVTYCLQNANCDN